MENKDIFAQHYIFFADVSETDLSLQKKMISECANFYCHWEYS